jgi:chromosome segregation ATPase
VAISSLLRLIEQISTASESAKISFLPPEAQKEILAINSAIDKYSQSIEAAKTETKELVSARASLATIEEKLANAKSDHAFKENELKESKEEIDRAKDAIAAIEARKKALAEYRAEQEKIEKFYSTPNEDGSKKNRSKKYDEVSGRPQDIKKKIAALEEQSKGDEEALAKEKEALNKAKSNYDSYIKTTETAKRKVDELNFKHEEAAKKVK